MGGWPTLGAGEQEVGTFWRIESSIGVVEVDVDILERGWMRRRVGGRRRSI